MTLTDDRLPPLPPLSPPPPPPPLPPPPPPPPPPYDAKTNTLGVVVRRLRAPVATRLSRYSLPTIGRNADVDPDFKDFTPDGPGGTEDSENLTREANSWGTGIWRPFSRRRMKKAEDPRVLTLRKGILTADDQKEDEEYYLRKRDYQVSKLPVFDPRTDQPVSPGDDTDEVDAGVETHRCDPASRNVDLLAPGHCQARNYDTIRLALYAEAMNAWRQLTDVRFRLMSLLPAISIVAFIPLFLVIQGGNPFIAAAGLVLALLGLGLTHGLHIYEQRNDGLYNDLISRARRIEAELGVDTGVMLGRLVAPTPKVNHGRATEWVYRCVKLAWLTVAGVLAAATVVFAYDWITATDEIDRVQIEFQIGTAGPSGG